MITIDLELAKERISELIDSWSEEVINDLLMEIKNYAETGNIKDIELTLESIREIQKKGFETKQKVTKSKTFHRIFSSLDCDSFEEMESTIISKIFDLEIKIKK